MAWFDSMGLKDDHTIKAYYYDLASEDPGIFNVDGIEKESRKLLEDLAGGKLYLIALVHIWSDLLGR